MNTERRYHLLGILLLSLLAVAPSLRAASAVDVQVSGVEGELLENVRASLSLERWRQQQGLTAERIAELHEKAAPEIRRALAPFGYYRVGVAGELQAPGQAGQPWRASYRIDPGAPVPVARLAISLAGPGGDDPALATLAADSKLNDMVTLDHRRYEAGKQALLQALHRQGYRDAAYQEAQVTVDLERYQADVVLTLASGPQYRFGELDYQQQGFHPEYLARYQVIEPGAPYNEQLLARQRQLLAASGHFREVELLPQSAPAGSPHTIPVQVRLARYPNNIYRGRLGWGTDTGAGVQLNWNRRYAGSRGQQLNAGIAGVEERNRVGADLNYIWPLDPLAGERLEFGGRHEGKDLTFEDVELEEGGETRIEVNLASLNWHLSRATLGSFELQRKLSLSLLAESYDVFEVLFGNLPDSAQRELIELIGREAYETLAPEFEAVVPGVEFALRRADDRLFIRDGDFLRLRLLGAAEALGSNMDFWQAGLETRHIRPMGESGRLLLRSAMGYSEADSSQVLGVTFNDMPEYFEYRAGGARSVRGYGFEKLFPGDAITGGRHLLVGSVEYEYTVIPDWSVAAFWDAGNSFNRWDDYEAKQGVGIGLRWRSPVGLARVDLGFPLDDAEDAFQIYITVGPEF